MNKLMVETTAAQSIAANDAAVSSLANHVSIPENISAEQLLVYAQKMAFCRDRLSSLLNNSMPGLLAMAEKFVEQYKAETKLSEIINKNSKQFQGVQEASFVQDTPKQLAEKLFSGFSKVLNDFQNKTLTNKRCDTKFIHEIQFLPHFLSQVINRLEKNQGTDISIEELARLKLQEQGMNSARQAMINHNLGLVMFTAKQYGMKNFQHIDLVQEGTVGLIKAVDRYDCKRSVKFSTYAIYWIRQEMTRAICRQEKMIRLPFNLAAKAPSIYAAMRLFLQEHNKWPTNAEIASLTECTEQEIDTIIAHYQPIQSLSSHVNDDEQMPELENILVQQQFPSAQSELLGAEMRSFLVHALNRLTQRETEVVNCRFGLVNHQEMTLQEIGDKYALTRERVRQIQNNALRKLKNNFTGNLSDFIESG